MTTLTLIDEATSGAATPIGTLAVPELRLTVREILRRRVRLEVELRGAGDAEAAFRAAVRAFDRNGFLMFVGTRQVEDLDEVVELTEDAEVTFLKLIALAGG
ncbi:hypothetical protein [Catenulispora subtropica]|uniref:hypothetical protein n=1 Tax=Catenulispora subtropica TaxID=450798 RepID=UPI0031D940A7